MSNGSAPVSAAASPYKPSRTGCGSTGCSVKHLLRVRIAERITLFRCFWLSYTSPGDVPMASVSHDLLNKRFHPLKNVRCPSRPVPTASNPKISSRGTFRRLPHLTSCVQKPTVVLRIFAGGAP